MAVIKHNDWKQVGEVRVYLAHSSGSLNKVRTGTQAELEPRGRSWCTGHGAVLLIGFLHLVCSVCFLIEHRTRSPGMFLPTNAWALYRQWLIKKMLYRLADLKRSFPQSRFPHLTWLQFGSNLQINQANK